MKVRKLFIYYSIFIYRTYKNIKKKKTTEKKPIKISLFFSISHMTCNVEYNIVLFFFERNRKLIKDIFLNISLCNYNYNGIIKHEK